MLTDEPPLANRALRESGLESRLELTWPKLWLLLTTTTDMIKGLAKLTLDTL